MDLLKALLPGSLAFLLFGLLAGLILSRRPGRGATWGRRLIAALAVSYAVIATPAGAGMMTAPLVWGFQPLSHAAEAQGAGAVVVLDGGTTRCLINGHLHERANEWSASRAAEAVRVARILGEPLVIVTGGTPSARAGWSLEGETLRHEIIRGGVPAGRVLLDPVSLNTRAHALTVSRLLRERGIGRIVLVTSDTHIRRAAAVFRAQGVDLIASPATACEGARGWQRLWPSSTALRQSEGAIYDYAGLVYYWVRGWV